MNENEKTPGLFGPGFFMIWGTFEGIIRGPGRTQNKKPPQSAEYKKTFRGGGLICCHKKIAGNQIICQQFCQHSDDKKCPRRRINLYASKILLSFLQYYKRARGFKLIFFSSRRDDGRYTVGTRAAARRYPTGGTTTKWKKLGRNTPNRNRTYIPCLEGRCSIH